MKHHQKKIGNMRSENIQNHGENNCGSNVIIPKHIEILVCSIYDIVGFDPKNRAKNINIHDHQIS